MVGFQELIYPSQQGYETSLLHLAELVRNLVNAPTNDFCEKGIQWNSIQGSARFRTVPVPNFKWNYTSISAASAAYSQFTATYSTRKTACSMRLAFQALYALLYAHDARHYKKVSMVDFSTVSPIPPFSTG